MVASYERGVQDTETKLTKEEAVVCRDYCTESGGVAMDRAGVPANFELRRIESIFFLEDIREISNSDPPAEKPLPAQAAVPNPSVLGGEGVDKKAQPPIKDKPSENTLRIRDVISRAKGAESKSKAKGDHPETADPAKSPLKDKA